VGVAIVSACGFTASSTVGGGDGGTEDSTPDDSVIVDAPPDVFIPSTCPTAGKTCVGAGERLRDCSMVGATPMDTICPWRCADAPAPHCRVLQPSGGAVLPSDLEPVAGLGDFAISAIATVQFNTDTGAITNGGFPVSTTGSLFVKRNGVAIWRFGRLTISGINIEFTGASAAALVAITEINISGSIDLQGDCNARASVASGGAGGDDGKVGGGSGGGGAGAGNDTSCTGGGGGGNGASGGSGGGGSTGGLAFTTPEIASLVGGGGGGGGGGGMGGDGGGGGGALHLVANAKVRVNGNFGGGIQAGGCGGKAGGSCGGGGGAGGTILVEAAVIELLNGTFAVNGGGGGGGKSGTSGQAAHFSGTRASGGNGGTLGMGSNGGDGGDGGDDGAFDGASGQSVSRAGGGGGAVGRIRFHTLSGMIMRQNVVFSPLLATPAMTTPVSQGSASLQ